MSESKPCARCGGERHYTGSRWRCSRCFNEWQKNRRENLSPERYAEFRAKSNANRVISRAALSPEKRAEINAAVAAWREVNRERHRRVTREWYQRNAEHARAAKIAEYYRNPQAFYARNWVRKARCADAVCEHGAECVSGEFLKELFELPCMYCGATAQHADHFYPIARGGLHCVENVVPACQPCNSSKYARDPFEFMESRKEVRRGSVDG